MTEEIREKIADAQMVLVGIGKELEERFHGMEQDWTKEGLWLPAAVSGNFSARILSVLRFRKFPPDRKRRFSSILPSGKSRWNS